MNVVKFEVNGKTLKRWKTIEVQDAIDQAAASFEATASSNYGMIGIDLNVGDKCSIFIDESLILTGYIDTYEDNITATSHELSISGRSITGDIIDCSAVHTPGNFVNQDILQISTELTSRFGVNVKLGSNVKELKKIELFEINLGESVFETIERLARKEGLLVTSNSAGDLLLEHGSDGGSYGFILDKWKSATLSIDHSERFSRYIGRGQQSGSWFFESDKAAQTTAEAIDPGVKRYRPIIVRPEGSSNSQVTEKRVKWQANRNIGRSIKYSCVLNGYYGKTGLLWEKNKEIEIVDKVLNVNRILLIESVNFKKDTNGSTTELTLVHPHAYQEELPKKEEKTGGYFDWLGF